MSEFEAVSSICSQEKVHLEMLQSGWLRAFWSISQEQDFSYYRICVGTQFMTKIFFKFKKPYFWPTFGAKKVFSENLGSVTHFKGVSQITPKLT